MNLKYLVNIFSSHKNEFNKIIYKTLQINLKHCKMHHLIIQISGTEIVNIILLLTKNTIQPNCEYPNFTSPKTLFININISA
jgi:hypothetical protein